MFSFLYFVLPLVFRRVYMASITPSWHVYSSYASRHLTSPFSFQPKPSSSTNTTLTYRTLTTTASPCLSLHHLTQPNPSQPVPVHPIPLLTFPINLTQSSPTYASLFFPNPYPSPTTRIGPLYSCFLHHDFSAGGGWTPREVENVLLFHVGSKQNDTCQ